MRRRRSVVFWLLVIVLLILVLGVIFGGYRKGTRLGDPAPVTGYGATVLTSCPVWTVEWSGAAR